MYFSPSKWFTAGWLLLLATRAWLSVAAAPAKGALRTELRSLLHTDAPQEVRYYLLQYSNQFCGGSIGGCQRLYNDGLCRRSGDVYVKMTTNGNGTVSVKPGSDSDCHCANAAVLAENYVVDELDLHGQWTAEQNRGCKTSHGIGVRMVKGTWCEASYFNSCQPKDSKFTKLIKTCPSTDVDVSGGGMCNYHSFHVKGVVPMTQQQQQQHHQELQQQQNMTQNTTQKSKLS